jgi:hypothetical protein
MLAGVTARMILKISDLNMEIITYLVWQCIPLQESGSAFRYQWVGRRLESLLNRASRPK